MDHGKFPTLCSQVSCSSSMANFFAYMISTNHCTNDKTCWSTHNCGKAQNKHGNTRLTMCTKSVKYHVPSSDSLIFAKLFFAKTLDAQFAKLSRYTVNNQSLYFLLEYFNVALYINTIRAYSWAVLSNHYRARWYIYIATFRPTFSCGM